MSVLTESLDESVIEDIYLWIDQIPLSKPKKNFSRDFSDGSMVAEVISHYFPKFVELHNYPSTTVSKTKLDNWATMNRKVLKKLDIQLSEEVMRDITLCKPFVVERLLLEIRQNIDTMLFEQHKRNTQADAPEADQYTLPLQKKVVKMKKVPAPNPPPEGKGRRRAPAETSKLVSTTGSSVVSRWLYDQKEFECKQQEETIQMLQIKVEKMEQLLQLKALRIDELTAENHYLKKENKIKGAKGSFKAGRL
ncbi:sperm flagellar protein 1-like [Watersipora subatra]|uniref:sperm flagellar protein 1-like n=1 Tax=Watersipora subatra TaxID=2589382 RepID=UPI00355AE5CB